MCGQTVNIYKKRGIPRGNPSIVNDFHPNAHRIMRERNKHWTLCQCCFNVGSSSTTL